ncbi:alkane hydroxylase MAH1-like [Rutidosis leptorrhynchoides]|uniref:alkane hydroxylase MAH1-like n=1 Tax=Rutidosis leptorrhynchoides TaxID=125765 RepID=UPI003A9918C1
MFTQFGFPTSAGPSPEVKRYSTIFVTIGNCLTKRVRASRNPLSDIRAPHQAGMDFLAASSQPTTENCRRPVVTPSCEHRLVAQTVCSNTCDPANVNHILSRNFGNYEKDPEFKEIFEPLGDGILSADSDCWRIQRRMMHAMVKNSKFELYLCQIVNEKITTSLIPALEHFAEHETEAFDEMEEAVLYRHVVPMSVWKLLKWLQIGEEKRLKAAWDRFDDFLYDCISRKQEQLRTMTSKEVKFDLLTAFMVEEAGDEKLEAFMKTNKFVREVAFNLLVAGRDSNKAGMTWFFYLVVKHPFIEAKILEEIKSELPADEDISKQVKLLSTEDLMNKFVYHQAALFETLRLYPPLPINEKTAIESDILPSGHKIKRNSRILIPFYAMGRMPNIWGEDCLEFKPERCISEKGRLNHEPSYKFLAFNSGPRTCIGKDMSLIQIKMAAISVIWYYHIKIVEGNIISPSNSVVLAMANGLKVRFTKRVRDP